MDYIQLTEESALPEIGQFAPFKTILAIEDTVSAARQKQVSAWLVGAGSLYVMVCGTNCQSWQESLRQANLDQIDIDDMKPEEFVMITTHEHERLRNIFWHAKKVARHTHVKIDNILTVHVAAQNRSVEYLSMFEKA